MIKNNRCGRQRSLPFSYFGEGLAEELIQEPARDPRFGTFFERLRLPQ
jgi:hypothetical protein